MIIAEILKDSDYKLNQFSLVDIQNFQETIFYKMDSKGKGIPQVNCLIRNKAIKLTPEEVVRQLFLNYLIYYKEYPKDRIQLEYPVHFGKEVKRADIVVLDKDQNNVPYIIIELKKPKLKDGKEQLKSYCNGTGAPIGVWTNGESIAYYHRKDPNYFEPIPEIPKSIESLTDILTQRWFMVDLIKNDRLVNEKISLKDLVIDMEDEVLANAGVDVF